jgi:hypothetical protein
MGKNSQTTTMTLKQFADLCGCKIVICGPGWGGRYGYTTDDAPNCTTCGFKTKAEVIDRWMNDTFGGVAGAAVQKLLSSNVVIEGLPEGSPSRMEGSTP